MHLRFGEWLLFPGTRRLTFRGETVHVGGRAFDILHALARETGSIVSHRTLIETAWNRSHFDEGSLRVQIAAIRRILASMDATVQVINIPGRGYMLVSDDDAVVTSHLPFPPVVHDQVPPYARLIGRCGALAEIRAEIGSHRLVSIIGPGGIGKTSLALALAMDLREEFDRVRFVDFSTVQDPADALTTAALALELLTSSPDPRQAIAASLRSGTNLLVLDGCEHVLNEVGTLADVILHRTLRTRILLTSREPLMVLGERIWRMSPLDLPPEGGVLSTEQALRYPAVELFVERAGALSTYRFSEDDVPVVVEICRRMDGIPLAIALAAAWIGIVSPRVLASEVGIRLMLEAAGDRTAPLRHRSLQAVLGWSYDRLSPERQRVLSRLAVFPGTFSLDDAAAIASDAVGDRRRVMQHILALAAKSMVETMVASDRSRCRLLDMTRAFALDRLVESGEESTIRKRHAERVLEWLLDVDASWIPGDPGPWPDRYAERLDDIRAALNWVSGPDGDPGLAKRLVDAAGPTWFRLSLPAEGLTHVDRILPKVDPISEPVLMARLNALRGVLLPFANGSPAEITQAWAQAMSSFEATDDPDTAMVARWWHWKLGIYGRRPELAREHARAFRDLAEAGYDEAALVAAAVMQAYAAFGAGELAEARRCIETVLSTDPLYRRPTGPLRFHYDCRTMALCLLSRIEWLAGRPDAALLSALDAVSAAQETAHAMTISLALLDGVAQIACLDGQISLAQKALARRSAIAGDDFSDPAERAIRATLLATTGDHAAAGNLARGIVASEWNCTVVFARSSMLVGRLAQSLGLAGYVAAGFDLLRLACPPESDARDPIRPDLLRARACLASLERHGCDDGTAQVLLDEALAQAVAQGSVAWAEAIRSEIASLGDSSDTGGPAGWRLGRQVSDEVAERSCLVLDLLPATRI